MGENIYSQDKELIFSYIKYSIRSTKAFKNYQKWRDKLNRHLSEENRWVDNRFLKLSVHHCYYQGNPNQNDSDKSCHSSETWNISNIPENTGSGAGMW